MASLSPLKLITNFHQFSSILANKWTETASYRDARTHLNIFQEKLCNDLAEIIIFFLAQKLSSLLALNLVFTPTDGRMDGQIDGWMERQMDGWTDRLKIEKVEGSLSIQ